MEREDFTSDNPSDRAPGGCEEGLEEKHVSNCFARTVKIPHNVDADEGDKNTLAGKVVDRHGDTNDRNDVFADGHTGGTNEEQPAATEAFDTPDTRECHEHVHDVRRNRDEETIADARIEEESCAIVEDEVDCEGETTELFW